MVNKICIIFLFLAVFCSCSVNLYKTDTKLKNPIINKRREDRFFTISGLDGAVIRYTTNGRAPDNKSEKYTGGEISVNPGTVIKAKAFKRGWIDSGISEKNVELDLKLNSAYFANKKRSVVLKTNYNNGIIEYYFDGNKDARKTIEDENDDGEFEILDVSSNGKGIAAGTLIEGFIYSNDNNPRLPFSYKVDSNPQICDLSKNELGDDLDNNTRVRFACSVNGVEYKYTYGSGDHDRPSDENLNTFSCIGDDEVLVPKGIILQVFGRKQGYDDSEVRKFEIGFNLRKYGEQYHGYRKREVVLTCDAAGDAKIYYTIDGSGPTEKSGLLYDREKNYLVCDSNARIRAVAFKSGIQSNLIDEDVESNFEVSKADIGFDYIGGGKWRIALRSDTPDADIRYTIDGSEPTLASARYVDEFEVNKGVVVKARAYKDGYDYSDISMVGDEIKSNPVAEYKVNYYHQNLQDDDYSLHESKSFMSEADVEVSEDRRKEYDGFVMPELKKIIPKFDEIVEISYFYNRKKSEVNFVSNNGNPDEKLLIKIGADESLMPTPVFEGHLFGGWFSDIDLTKPISEVKEDVNIAYAWWSDETKPFDFTYDRPDEVSALIKEYKGISEKVVVPEYIGGAIVNTILENAFDGCISITDLQIPKGVKNIAIGAFNGCNSLKNLVVPYAGCKRSESVVYPFGCFFGMGRSKSVDGRNCAPQYYRGNGRGLTYDFAYFYIPDSLESVIVTDQNEVLDLCFNNLKGIKRIEYIEPVDDRIGDKAFDGYEGEKVLK